MPKAEKVVANLVQHYKVEEILWDLDGTLVPGDGLEWDHCLQTHVVDCERLTALLHSLPGVTHSLASRNAQLEEPSDTIVAAAREIGFDRVIPGLCQKVDEPKSSPDGKRALLIDDSVKECRLSLGKETVVVALHLHTDSGIFEAVSRKQYAVVKPDVVVSI